MTKPMQSAADRGLEVAATAAFPFHLVNGTDHKAWAKRIMQRFERGAKDLEMVQITLAHEALGIEKQKES